MISELRLLREEYGVESFFFLDDSFSASKKRLVTICEQMIKNNLDLPWYCSTRVYLVNLESLKLMRKAGCVEILFGIESGSQRILNALKKGTTVEQNRNTARIFKKVGIKANGSFMIGNPTGTLDEIKATERFIEEEDLDGADVSVAVPFPGTEFWNWAQERGLIPEKVDWSHLELGAKVSVPDVIPMNIIRVIHTKLSIKCFIKTHGKLRFIKEYTKKPGTVLRYVLSLIKH